MDTKRPARPWSVLVGALVLVALIAVWAAQGTLAGSGVPIGRAATIAVGMTLQAIPFLLLGVFVAELIEAFVSPALIARVFPTNPVASVLTALVAAFLLPVCDCSAVPIFRSLLRKGVPLSAVLRVRLVGDCGGAYRPEHHRRCVGRPVDAGFSSKRPAQGCPRP